jgi:hypothetical protein
MPINYDESSFLAALLTAVCRPSLWLAPGLIVTSPSISGSGTGKGMLIRALCLIAFGNHPRPFTAGGEPHELDKRIAAELMEAHASLFLDNVNGAVLRSDTLASALTERPSRVRPLGVSRMVQLNSAAFVAITGNGLTISEDLARRFLTVRLDAQHEAPEGRPFAPGFLDAVLAHRADLLGAAMTILRWGLQNPASLTGGRPLGSFEHWGVWVRDPLLSLDCPDPVEKVDETKARDPRRRQIAELYATWWNAHGSTPMTAASLADSVQRIIDPQARGRQYVAVKLANLVGTRLMGFVLTGQSPVGTWGATTYALQKAKSVKP